MTRQAPEPFKCLNWWEKALEDINSEHDVEYDGHIEEEELSGSAGNQNRIPLRQHFRREL